ncbi:hypothetical protein [Rhodopseudomonas sp. B29]|uniref:hypothetical protein n=1 Tax=Rhodopseudomonas sp. B29 TaxID=95607 RepID=UPI00034C7843|nr:hypothetical protein [Rhodopseudomonas sp. B29]
MTLATHLISKGGSTVPRVVGLAALVVLGAGSAWAENLPDSENGRYTFQPATEGVLRLDTRNGQVSTCRDKGDGWACYAVPDERAAYDETIGRLQAENERLKADNDQLKAQLTAAGTSSGKIAEALPKSDKLPQPEITNKDGQRKLEIPLPSDQDVDRVMGFLERAWRKLIDVANRVQRQATGGDRT